VPISVTNDRYDFFCDIWSQAKLFKIPDGWKNVWGDIWLSQIIVISK